LKANHNKYYCIELHSAVENGKEYYRIFTHYGRTDDLVSKKESGQKECRFYPTLDQAEVRITNYIYINSRLFISKITKLSRTRTPR